MFVIQYKRRHWESKWYTSDKRYPTLAEAKDAFEKLPIKADHRIAEEYTVIRYKAVK